MGGGWIVALTTVTFHLAWGSQAQFPLTQEREPGQDLQTLPLVPHSCLVSPFWHVPWLSQHPVQVLWLQGDVPQAWFTH
jgi:hypothetical protein